MSEPERNFYQTLVPDDFLHAYPEKDIYDMLDDSFFLRIADHYCFTDVGKARGGNMGKFQDFLDLAEERAGLLPPWWSARKRRECEKTARETERMAPGSEDYDTKDFVVDHALIHAYKDYNIPMKLRLLAEKIYGSRATPEWWGEAGALKNGP
ncbi:MAG: hypothetical protein ASARMPREDX12_003735 [Alectoria sarmentosa]|nr:MAG: hypothetical protein ASARMPREDX12_003735 [Alectoria sarmentosa]